MRVLRKIVCRDLNSVWPVAFVVLLLIAGVRQGSSQNGTETPPKVRDIPLTAEQLGVYRATLAIWFRGDRAALNLSELTSPADAIGGDAVRDCGKGVSFEPVVTNVVHRVRKEDLGFLGSPAIRLVDPGEQAKEVEANDPGKVIRTAKGETDVAKAVDNGFAHGLFTLGEIQFDKTHKYAIVSFSFVCGGLCGNGNTWRLKKSGDTWRRLKMCGGWVS